MDICYSILRLAYIQLLQAGAVAAMRFVSIDLFHIEVGRKDGTVFLSWYYAVFKLSANRYGLGLSNEPLFIIKAQAQHAEQDLNKVEKTFNGTFLG